MSNVKKNLKGKNITLRQEVDALHLHNDLLIEKCKRADSKVLLKSKKLDDCEALIDENDKKHKAIKSRLMISVLLNAAFLMCIFAMLFGSK